MRNNEEPVTNSYQTCTDLPLLPGGGVVALLAGAIAAPVFGVGAAALAAVGALALAARVRRGRPAGDAHDPVACRHG